MTSSDMGKTALPVDQRGIIGTFAATRAGVDEEAHEEERPVPPADEFRHRERRTPCTVAAGGDTQPRLLRSFWMARSWAAAWASSARALASS
ncbi:MAG: hypothetical protein M5U09_29260, partial [Gammaproteobacteria bacterium]|nr:hypothetical protein [Gammaproteobacteria bacterium]